MDVANILIGSVVMMAVPGYFVLQPMALLRFTGKWRTAAMVPLIGAAPALVFSLYALSQDSNLWPMMFIMFAPIGTIYLVALIAAHYFKTGMTGL